MMTTSSFFRLPIISFIVTFCLLFILFIIKLNDYSLPIYQMSYHSSPDFMQIIGLSLFIMLVMSVYLQQIHIYNVNILNGLSVILIVVLTVLSIYVSEDYFIEYFAGLFDLSDAKEYRAFQFWFPIISRVLALIISFCLISGIIKLVKFKWYWQDKRDFSEINISEIMGQIQLIYFILLYLAICFIFQRYLYISPYLLLGGNGLSEYHNFSFYLASVITIIMLVIFIRQKNRQYHQINFIFVIKTVGLILLSQLICSIIISFITIYTVQIYFVVNVPEGDAYYSHYVHLLYVMLNSIFMVSLLTCSATYFIGRFWLKKLYFFT